MFEEAIKQIKESAKDFLEKSEKEHEGKDPSHISLGLPSLFLMLWAACALFGGYFTFDPTYAINFPRLIALFVLLYMAARDYTLAEKEIETMK